MTVEKLTLEQIENLEKNMLIPTDIAGYLGADTYAFTIQAKQDSSKLPFPVMIIGNRVKIPKVPFVKVMRGEMFFQRAKDVDIWSLFFSEQNNPAS